MRVFRRRSVANHLLVLVASLALVATTQTVASAASSPATAHASGVSALREVGSVSSTASAALKPRSAVSAASSFLEPIEIPLGLGGRQVGSQSQVTGLAAGHFSSSGHEDLAVAAYNTTTGEYFAEVLEGNGSGGFPTTVPLALGDETESTAGVIGADLTGSSSTDIVVASPSADALYVYSLNNTGTFDFHEILLPASPTEVQAADLGNGHVDLVAMVPSKSEVIPILTDGTLTTANWTVGSALKVTGTPDDLALAPLVSGGADEIVVAVNDDDTTNGIQIFTNSGTGTFNSTPTSVPDGMTGTNALYVGDFSGGSTADIVVTGGICIVGSTNYCQILLTGNGDGTFAAPSASQTSPMPSGGGTRGPTDDSVPPELNGDTNPDVLWVEDNLIDSTYSSTMLTTGMGDGSGGFTMSEAVDTTEPDITATAVVAASITGSGNPWLVVGGSANYEGAGGLWLIPPQPGTPGTYETSTAYIAQETTDDFGVTGNAVEGTFDEADPGPDLAILASGAALGSTDGIDLLPSIGHGRYGTPIDAKFDLFHPTGAAVGLVAGDFSGNGHQDLAWIANDGQGIGIAMGNGDGTFKTPTYVSDGSIGGLSNVDMHLVNLAGTGVEALEVDGTIDTGDETLATYLWNAGTDTFSTPTSTDLGPASTFEGINEIAFGHFTASANLDFAVDSNNTVTEFLGNGDGTFAAGTAVAPDVSSEYGGSIAAGDVNGDGNTDLVWETQNHIFVALGHGDGSFASPISYPETPQTTDTAPGQYLSLVDLAGSGNLDVVSLGGGGEPGVYVLPNLGQGVFGPAVDYATGNGVYGATSMTPVPVVGSSAHNLVVTDENEGASNPITVMISTGGGLGLTASAVTSPASAVIPGTVIDTTWTVTNDGTQPESGTWDDSVYLSSSSTFSPSDPLVGSFTHSGTLDTGNSYQGSLTAALPGTVAGPYYLIVVPDSGQLFPETQSGVGVSPPFTVAAVPTLTLGGPATKGTIKTGQVLYFQVSPAAGRALDLTALMGTANEATFAESDGVFPNPVTANADQTYATPYDTTQLLTVAHPSGGVAYVMLVGLAGAAGSGSSPGSSFSLLAQQPSFAVTSFDPTTFAHSYASITSPQCEVDSATCTDETLDVSGAGFTPATTITLEPTGTFGHPVAAVSVTYFSPNAVAAQFSNAATGFFEAGVPYGTYTVRASNGTSNANSTAIFTSETVGVPESCTASATGGGGSCPPPIPPLIVSLSSPANFRPPAPGAVTVSWQNTTAFDQAAPIIEIAADDANFIDPDTGLATGQSEIQLLGVGDGLQAGILLPDESGSITLNYTQPNVGVTTIAGYVVDPTYQVDWSSAEADMQPLGMSTPVWDATFKNFEADAGPTLGSYQALLDNAASYLSEIGQQPTGDAVAEQNLELATADEFGQLNVTESSGTQGPGAADATNVNLSVLDAAGDVEIYRGAATPLIYLAQPNGSYANSIGNPDTFVKETDGSYQLTDPSGNVTAWSSSGQLVSVTDGAGNSLAVTDNTSGDIASIAGPGGLTGSATYNTGGHVTSETDATGATVSQSYSSTGSSGTLTGVTTGASTVAVTEGALPDGTGFAPTSVTLPTGQVETITYDSRDRPVTETTGSFTTSFSYGPFGEVTAKDADGHSVTDWLDARDQIARTTNQLGGTTTYNYNLAGQLTSSVDPMGFVTSWTYNASGSVTTETDPDGNTTAFGYNATGLTSSVTTPNGNTTQYTYNPLGQPTLINFPNGTTESFTYNTLGLMTSATTPAGKLVTYNYNGSNLLATVYVSGTLVLQYSYNSHRQVISVNSAAGTTSRILNAEGQIVSQTEPSGAQLKLTYNANGEVSSESDGSGYVVNRNYNAEGLVSGITDGSDHVLATLSYDDEGLVSQVQMGNGTSVDYTRDAVGQLTGETYKSPTNAVTATYSATYNADGLPTTETGPAGTSNYDYDADGALVGATLANSESLAYTYDADGNRTSSTLNGTTTTYSVNKMDEYTSVGGENYVYDLNGDLIGESGGAGTSSFTYSPLGQLTAATTPLGSSSYTYDGFNNRVTATRDSVETQYLPSPFDPSDVFATYNQAGTLTAHVVDDSFGEVASIGASSGATYLETDISQNVIAETSATGAINGTASYDPYGNVTSSTGTMDDAGFAGSLGTTSEGDGIDSVRVRAYDPVLGRFLTPDSTVTAGANPYTYAEDSPVGLVDFTGDDPGPTDDPSTSEILANTAEITENVARAITAVEVAADTAGTALTAYGNAVINTGIAVVQDAGTAAVHAGHGLEAGAGALGVVSLTFDAGTELNRLTNGTDFNGSPTDMASDIGFATVDGAAIASAGTPIGPAVIAIAGAGHGINFIGTRGIKLFYNLTGQWDTEFNWGPAMRKHFPNGHIPIGLTHQRNLHDLDPNDINGPAGYGPAGFISDTGTSAYSVEFSNEASANAPVQVVRVTETLDKSLNVSSFRFGQVGFASTYVTPPSGQQSWSLTVPESSTVNVRMTGSIDPATRVVTWTFSALDPLTNALVTDPAAGFLPPDVVAPEGEGQVAYSVQPNTGLATGTKVKAQATVVFDQNAPLSTTVVSNEIDSSAPTTLFTPPPFVSKPGALHLRWSGNDHGGSGVASYQLFESVNGAPFTRVGAATTKSFATVVTKAGKLYEFAVAAADHVGNGTGWQPAVQAVTSTQTVAQRNTAFVKASYQSFLGKLPSKKQLSVAVAALDKGQLSAAAFVTPLVDSPWWVSSLVRDDYEQVFGKVPSNAVVANAQKLIRDGKESVGSFVASLYASNSFYSGQVKNSLATWVRTIYQQTTGSKASATLLRHWESVTRLHGRATAALGLLDLTASSDQRLELLYARVLDVPPSTSQLKIEALQIEKFGEISVAETVASSPEFYDSSQVRFP